MSRAEQKNELGAIHEFVDSVSDKSLLQISDLEVRFPSRSGSFAVVDRVNLTVDRGEVLGLVGESGCGKTMLARSILQLVTPPGEIVRGSISFNNIELLELSTLKMRHLRGNKIAFVPQEPMTSLNPTLKIGHQLYEVLRSHRPTMSRVERKDRALEVMEQVDIQFANQRLNQYPHELSGGIRQRVMIAMALICGGVELLIADEPTTALDVTIQAQILELFVQLQSEHNMAVLLITHDLSVVAQTTHRVAVMYAGTIVEIASVFELFETPLHPYARGLLESLPRRGVGKHKSHLPAIAGTVPNPAQTQVGCRFYDRCPFAIKSVCSYVVPPLEEAAPKRWVRCHRWRELPAFELPKALAR